MKLKKYSMIENVFLESNNIYLRVLIESDVSGNYKNWLNNPDVNKYNSHGRFPKTEFDLLDFIRSNKNNNKNIILAIIEKTNNKHIGNISLQNINWVDRNVEIAFLLGEKDFWGKGIMFEAGTLLIKHAFNTLNLHRVYCGTSSENKSMQKLATKLGMSLEGVRREALFKNGKYVDIMEYGIINK
ncbi:MAG: GNAT family protein [Candidatus Sericytochromatia bacterium]